MPPPPAAQQPMPDLTSADVDRQPEAADTGEFESPPEPVVDSAEPGEQAILAPDVSLASRIQFDYAPEDVPTSDKLREHPHACIALSEEATWGSLSSGPQSDTDVPSSHGDDQDLDATDWEQDLDDGWVVQGGVSPAVESRGESASDDTSEPPPEPILPVVPDEAEIEAEAAAAEAAKEEEVSDCLMTLLRLCFPIYFPILFEFQILI